MEMTLCFKCKIALVKTELANVYECPMCKNVEEILPKNETVNKEEE